MTNLDNTESDAHLPFQGDLSVLYPKEVAEDFPPSKEPYDDRQELNSKKKMLLLSEMGNIKKNVQKAINKGLEVSDNDKHRTKHIF